MIVGDAALAGSLRPLPLRWEPTSLRRAAVLAPLFRRDGEDWLLFTVRPLSLREHAGQVSFPGGTAHGDEDPVACALREAEEELGLPAARIALLGGLEPCTSSSGYRVHCVVGRVPDPLRLRPDPREVARLLSIPCRLLVDRSRWQLLTPPDRPGNPYPPSPHFAYGDDVVWGLTGRLAQDLAAHLPAPA